MGFAARAVELAWRDHHRDGQLRRGLCARAQGRPQPPDRIDGRRGGYSGRGAARRPELVVGILRPISRRGGAPAARYRYLRPTSARRAARLCDGRAGRAARSCNAGRYRPDACARGGCDARRRDRVFHFAHAQPSHGERRSHAVAARDGSRACGHRAGPRGCRQRRDRVDLGFRHARSRKRVRDDPAHHRGVGQAAVVVAGAGPSFDRRLARHSEPHRARLDKTACRSAHRSRRAPLGCCSDFRVRSIPFPRSLPSSRSRTSP